MLWLGGTPVELTDTAGLRESTSGVENEGIARAERAARDADIVFFVLDGSRPLNVDDQGALSFVDQNKNTIYLINKSDLELKLDVQSFKKLVLSEKVFFVSAKNNTGIQEIKGELLSIVKKSSTYDGEVCLVQPRHYEIYTRVLQSLNQAYEGCCTGIAPEYVAHDVSRALEVLGEIRGEKTYEDIIQKIFSEFCIGK